MAYYRQRDPVDRARDALTQMAGVDAADVAAMEAEIQREFELAVEFSKASGKKSVESFKEFVASY